MKLWLHHFPGCSSARLFTACLSSGTLQALMLMGGTRLCCEKQRGFVGVVMGPFT